jgi:hypothetical protein
MEDGDRMLEIAAMMALVLSLVNSYLRQHEIFDLRSEVVSRRDAYGFLYLLEK